MGVVPEGRIRPLPLPFMPVALPPAALLAVAILAVAILAAAPGCGYRFAAGGALPPDVRRVFIPLLENRTGVTGIETVFTNDLIFEFTRDQRLRPARSAEAADAILKGVVKSARTETISHRSRHVALERRVSMTFAFSLARADGAALWSDATIAGEEAYAVSNDRRATDYNLRQAMEEISRRVAESVYNRLITGF